MACLGREKMPREKWFCPWHHCVTCGKPAAAYCIHCPNAYCSEHNTVIFDHPELGRMCDEHEEDIGNLIEFYRKVEGGVSSLPPNPNITSTNLVVEAKREEWNNSADDIIESSQQTENNLKEQHSKQSDAQPRSHQRRRLIPRHLQQCRSEQRRSQPAPFCQV